MLLALQPATVGLFVLIASSGGVPTVDIKKTCRTSEKQLSRTFNRSALNFGICQTARVTQEWRFPCGVS
jgi:hypothetical protein